MRIYLSLPLVLAACSPPAPGSSCTNPRRPMNAKPVPESRIAPPASRRLGAVAERDFAETERAIVRRQRLHQQVVQKFRDACAPMPLIHDWSSVSPWRMTN
jgi:hypothetical protein